MRRQNNAINPDDELPLLKYKFKKAAVLDGDVGDQPMLPIKVEVTNP